MLSDTKIRNAKPQDRPYKLSDFDGLYLFITPTGTRSWRFDYRHADKRYTQTLGKYPDVSLADARNYLRGARTCLASGKNPQHEQQKEKIRKAAASCGIAKNTSFKWRHRFFTRTCNTTTHPNERHCRSGRNVFS